MGITEYVQVIAERIPEEDLEPGSELIQAFHFQGEPSKSHGIPFRFKIIPGEIFSDTKKRLEKRTGMKGKNFEKIKFAVVKRSSYSKPTYLTDGKYTAFGLVGQYANINYQSLSWMRCLRLKTICLVWTTLIDRALLEMGLICKSSRLFSLDRAPENKHCFLSAFLVPFLYVMNLSRSMGRPALALGR
jgi:hypothetical protein